MALKQILTEKEAIQLKIKIARKQALFNKLKQENLTFYFKPYKWMLRYIESIRNHQIVIIPAPNKIGKCNSVRTKISTPDGEVTMGELYKRGKPFDVYAWDGKKKVIAKALPPFKKEGLHECYKINMSDGRFIECADHHKILTASGSYCSAESLLKFFSSLQESTWGSSPLTRVLDVRHLQKIVRDYQDRYLSYSRRHGGQLPLGEDIDQVSFLLQADVLRHNDPAFQMDALGNKYKHSHPPFYDHLSNSYALNPNVAQHDEFLFRIFGIIQKLAAFLCRGLHRLSSAANPLLLPSRESEIHTDSNPFLTPFYPEDNHIISYNPIGLQEVYDFTVEKYHNYFAGGLIHHNTACTANIVGSWCLGFEPWNEVKKDYPEAVEYQSKYYRASSLGIKPPVKIIISGEDWSEHLGKTVIPELEKWLPKDEYTTKNNQGGFKHLFMFKNGSILSIMSHNQEDELFESFVGHGWWPDEPPPKTKFTGIQRGLKGTYGKTVIPTTPLRQAWMLDDLVLSGRRDIAVIDDLKLTDNDDYVGKDLVFLTEMGLNEEQTKEYYRLAMYVADMGKKAEQYLYSIAPPEKQDLAQKLIILNFVKDCPLNERDTRLFGMFKSLVGRILKDFDKDKHIVEAFPFPPDNPVIAMIDFHLNKPHAISFYGVDKRDFKYVLYEVFENMSSESIADTIIRAKKANSWRLERAQIDPLSKGDTQYMKNRIGDDIEDSFTVIKNKLAEYDIELEVASKDKTSGITNVETWLKGPNGKPEVFFFDSLQSVGDDRKYGHVFEIMRWVYDDEGKPIKENDHFMENLYRVTLAGLKYEPLPDPVNYEAARKAAEEYDPLGR